MMKSTIKILMTVLVFALMSALAYAAPQGPTIALGQNETGTVSSSGQLVQASAGNLTSVTVTSTRITNRWQGFYGNVSGTITLDDALGNTIYQWADASPQGEIYAVNNSRTPVWANVICFNTSTSSTTQNISLSTLENSLGMSATDGDGVNETFNLTYTGSFTIGDSNTIDGTDNCSMTSLWASDASNQLAFNETLLMDNTSDLIIYMALLEQDTTGFQGSTLDFQMIVGEDGGTTGASNYYFYVELS